MPRSTSEEEEHLQAALRASRDETTAAVGPPAPAVVEATAGTSASSADDGWILINEPDPEEACDEEISERLAALAIGGYVAADPIEDVGAPQDVPAGRRGPVFTLVHYADWAPPLDSRFYAVWNVGGDITYSGVHSGRDLLAYEGINALGDGRWESLVFRRAPDSLAAALRLYESRRARDARGAPLRVRLFLW